MGEGHLALLSVSNFVEEKQFLKKSYSQNLMQSFQLEEHEVRNIAQFIPAKIRTSDGTEKKNYFKVIDNRP